MSAETSVLAETDVAVVRESAPRPTRARFVAEELASPVALTTWINNKAAEGYHLVSITSMIQTNHFNKELGSVAWVVMELAE